jgi:hypothetical protein
MTRTKRWLIALVALIVAAMMLLADLASAQQQGRGMGRRGQGGQAWAQGQGLGNQNCPNYPGYRNSWQGRGNQSQARQGRRLNQPVNPPAPENPAPQNLQ